MTRFSYKQNTVGLHPPILLITQSPILLCKMAVLIHWFVTKNKIHVLNLLFSFLRTNTILMFTKMANRIRLDFLSRLFTFQAIQKVPKFMFIVLLNYAMKRTLPNVLLTVRMNKVDENGKQFLDCQNFQDLKNLNFARLSKVQRVLETIANFEFQALFYQNLHHFFDFSVNENTLV